MATNGQYRNQTDSRVHHIHFFQYDYTLLKLHIADNLLVFGIGNELTKSREHAIT